MSTLFNKLIKKGKGKIVRMKDDKDMPSSFYSLMGKDLEVTDEKEVFFASGNQTYYIINHEGTEFEVPARFTTLKRGKSDSQKLNKLSDELHKAFPDGIPFDGYVEKNKDKYSKKQLRLLREHKSLQSKIGARGNLKITVPKPD